ncbi:MAG: MFS transporter [Acetobacteraceae bacterium]
MAAVSASPRLKRIQRGSVALLVLGCAVNYVDRSTLAVANPLIRHDLGLSIADMGLLLSAFLWAYAAFQLPAGALVDRIGPRKLLGLGIFIWSLAQAGGGLVGGFWQFVVARVFLGMGESPQFSGLVRVVRDWFNVRERGLPTGIGLCGSKLGPAIAPPLLTVLMLAFGWRWMFIIMGGVGIGVAILWYAVYREPREVALTEDENAYLADGVLFAYRATWGMVLGFFGEVYMGWVYQAWLPGYLEIERHMSIAKTGWVAAIPFACGVSGSVGAGWLTDRLAARGVSPINSCKIPVVIGLTGMAAFTIVTALTPSTLVAVIAVSTALAFNGMAGAMCWALASVAAPRHCTASLGSIQNCGGYIGGALAPAITGFIVQDTGSFVPALLFSASLGLACAAVYVFMVPGKPIDVADFGVRAIA